MAADAPASPKTTMVAKAKHRAKRKDKEKPAGESKQTSMRTRVFAAVADWCSIAQIAKATSLTPMQIRAVLNAKELQDRIERRQVEGMPLEFKLKVPT